VSGQPATPAAKIQEKESSIPTMRKAGWAVMDALEKKRTKLKNVPVNILIIKPTRCTNFTNLF